MKICPLCGKEYDQTWSVCLECNTLLKTFSSAGDLNKTKQAIQEKRKTIGICSKCKKEASYGDIKRVEMRIGNIVDIRELCPACYKKKYPSIEKSIKASLPIRILIVLLGLASVPLGMFVTSLANNNRTIEAIGLVFVLFVAPTLIITGCLIGYIKYKEISTVGLTKGGSNGR